MTKYAVLFLLVGLAVGLWLGFNPAAHRDVVRWWNRVSLNQVGYKPHAAVVARQLGSRLNRALQSSPKPLAQPSEQPNTVPTLREIGAELHAFWLALEHIWLSFWAQLKM